MKKFIYITLAALCLVGMTTTDVQAKRRSGRGVYRSHRGGRLVGSYCRMVGRCNVRSGPGENYPVIQQLPNRHLVFVNSRSGDWYHITMYPGQDYNVNSGWTHRQNLRYDSPDDMCDGVNSFWLVAARNDYHPYSFLKLILVSDKINWTNL